MDFGNRSPGRIKKVTVEGEAEPAVSEWDKNEYMLINSDVCWADEPRTYVNDEGKTIEINQYNDVLEVLAKHSP